jgi:CheY-like chemotaxis protein
VKGALLPFHCPSKRKNRGSEMTTVLVVEDDPFNMELVVEILTSQGFTVEEAVDGREAIEKTEQKVYNLILMDIGLPEVRGVKAAKIIKNNPQYKNVPIIALTAYAMKGDRERYLAEGFDDYISKPIDVSDFMERMEKYRR